MIFRSRLAFLLAAAGCGYTWGRVGASVGGDPDASLWALFVAATTTMAVGLCVMMQADLVALRIGPRRIPGRYVFVGGLIFPLAVVSAIVSNGPTSPEVPAFSRAVPAEELLAEAEEETAVVPLSVGER